MCSVSGWGEKVGWGGIDPQPSDTFKVCYANDAGLNLSDRSEPGAGGGGSL